MQKLRYKSAQEMTIDDPRRDNGDFGDAVKQQSVIVTRRTKTISIKNIVHTYIGTCTFSVKTVVKENNKKKQDKRELVEDNSRNNVQLLKHFLELHIYIFLFIYKKIYIYYY